MIFFIIGPGYCIAFNQRDLRYCISDNQICAIVADEERKIHRVIYDGPNGDGHGITKINGANWRTQYWTVYINIYKNCYFTAYAKRYFRKDPECSISTCWYETWSHDYLKTWYSYEKETGYGWVGWWWQNDIRSFECYCKN